MSRQTLMRGDTAIRCTSPEHSNRSSPSLTRHTKALSSSPPVTASVLVLGSRLTQKTEASQKSKERLNGYGANPASPGFPRRSKPHADVGFQQAELPTPSSGNQFFVWDRSSTGCLLSLGPPAMMGGPKGSSARV